LTSCIIPRAITGAVVVLVLFTMSPAGPPKTNESKTTAKPKTAEEPKSKPTVKLPAPPERIADAAEQSQACLECHEELGELLEGDKHIADDFHCVVCHGPSEAHLEMEVEGTMPDRAWRRWVEEESRFEWRMKNASLEIARYCASCHGRKPAKGQKMKTMDWEAYLDSGHGLAVREGSHDAPTCTDCHYAHGAGTEPRSPDAIVERCAMCHGDREMMKRAGIDPDVMRDFQAATHGGMDVASPEEKASCIPCHHPHQ
jgi:hypothetical protein